MNIDIKKEIAEQKRKLAELESQLTNENRRKSIKDLSEFSVEDKVKMFDDLYNLALSVVEGVEKNNYVCEDDRQYMYEELMYYSNSIVFRDCLGILAHNKELFWQYFNGIYKKPYQGNG